MTQNLELLINRSIQVAWSGHVHGKFISRTHEDGLSAPPGANLCGLRPVQTLSSALYPITRSDNSFHNYHSVCQLLTITCWRYDLNLLAYINVLFRWPLVRSEKWRRRRFWASSSPFCPSFIISASRADVPVYTCADVSMCVFAFLLHRCTSALGSFCSFFGH